VGSNGVVLERPGIDHDPGLEQVVELLADEQLVAHRAVDGLTDGRLPFRSTPLAVGLSIVRNVEDGFLWVCERRLDVVRDLVDQLLSPKGVCLVVQNDAYVPKVEGHIILVR
jgi:hypothetical protein